MPADAYTFPLAWRWTQPSHNVLPPEVMACIIAIPEPISPVGRTARGELERASFDAIRSASADVPCKEGMMWLRQLPVVLTEQVIVRWDASTAVQTTWEVFTGYWDDFCYPISDDVQVFPQSDEWLLLYDHEEQFQWGRRRPFNSVDP